MENEKKLSKLEKLRNKQKKLAEQIKLAEARESHQARKDDTRRKILVGAYYLKQAAETGDTQKLYQKVRESVKRDNDKRLFTIDDGN